MELTIQQISCLLGAATQSSLEAEEIVSLIENYSGEKLPIHEIKPTVREVFSVKNISRFVGNEGGLATRIHNLVTSFPDRIGYTHLNQSITEAPLNDLRFWHGLGPKSKAVIRTVLAEHDIFL